MGVSLPDHQQSVRQTGLRHMLVTALVVLLAPLTTAAIAIGGVELPDPLGTPLEDRGIVVVDEPAADEPASIAPHRDVSRRGAAGRPSSR